MPVLLAICSAVSPLELTSRGFISGCRRRSWRAGELWELADAKWRGVWSPLLRALISAPCCNKSAAHSTLFQQQAECKGCQPSCVCASIAAFFSSKYWKQKSRWQLRPKQKYFKHNFEEFIFRLKPNLLGYQWNIFQSFKITDNFV